MSGTAKSPENHVAAQPLLLARDAEIVLRNRNRQLEQLGERLWVKETALQEVMDAVTLAEAKRLAREAIRFV